MAELTALDETEVGMRLTEWLEGFLARRMATRIMANQIQPQIIAEDLRRDGVPASVVFVNTGRHAEGHQVQCSLCGRVGRLPQPLPPDLPVVCPRCARSAFGTSSGS